MKFLKSFMPVIALLAICMVSKAVPLHNNGRTGDEAINIYINALIHGKLAGLDNAIDNSVQYIVIGGENRTVLYKSQVIQFLRSGENIEQNCTCTKLTIQDNEEAKVVKVQLKYSDFTRLELIKAQPGSGGWQITSIETSFI